MSAAEAHGIRAAAASRTVDATARSRRAVRELDRRGAEVNFAAVAAIANVSRQFLYTHSELRAEIESLRGDRHATLARLPAAERATDASIRARLRAALDENRRLREENTRLREELALAHGAVRELELERRVGQTTR